MGYPTHALQGSVLAESTASAPHMQSTLLAAGTCSRNPVQMSKSKVPNSFQPKKGSVWRGEVLSLEMPPYPLQIVHHDNYGCKTLGCGLDGNSKTYFTVIL